MPRFSRQENADGHSRASTLELFYDLVFVFAVTQVSHFLLDDLSWEGAGQAAVILMAVWWSWNYTTWTTNELDTSSPAVRVMVIAVMLGSLLMSVAIPEAWGDRALLFAGAYVAIQVGRHTFLAYAAGTAGSIERIRAERILIWFVLSGAFWIAGALADAGPARTTLWLIAVGIDYVAPFVTYSLPRLKKLGHDTWNVVSEHFTERFQLFVIVALGESIVITGATASDIEGMGFQTVLALSIAFIGSASLWWLYFNRAADRLSGHLEQAENRTLVARDIYTYLHVVVVAGIIVTAIGDEIVIAHPDYVLESPELLVVVGGPVLYLASLSLIRYRAIGSISSKRTTAAVAIALIGVLLADAAGIIIAALIALVLVVLIVAEEFSFERTDRRVRLIRR